MNDSYDNPKMKQDQYISIKWALDVGLTLFID